MDKFIRKNAWDGNGTFANTDLLWYAKGVGVMQSRTLDDPNSWWFFAAIHGEYIEDQEFPGWGFIPGPPNVPAKPAPSPSIQDKFWNQCQHQSWYFAPWHRGYLIALEAQIRAAIISLGGPSDWALPYWNYFGPNNEYMIPPAFMQQALPDGSANPLFVKARFGPNSDGNVYIQIPPVAQACQDNTLYTGSNAATSRPGYGGPATSFSHSGNISGNLESNPHNLIHVQVGGNPSDTLWGLMSDPGLAALDPIFYLHHCNIDRMWASWNAIGNQNPVDSSWLNGPAATGERQFAMPMPDGSAWIYTPAEVTSLSPLDYVYDGLVSAKTPILANALEQRLNKLGIDTAGLLQGEHMDTGDQSELVGANKGRVLVGKSGLRTTINFDSRAWQAVSESLMAASARDIPDKVYLQIENVKGNVDAHILAVSVGHQLAGHISLFGLRNASKSDGHDGGSGLTFILDITGIIDSLYMENKLAIDSLDVTLLPTNVIHDNQEITVGRISIYREQQR